MVTQTAGVLQRAARCQEHDLEYDQFQFPSMRIPGREPLWTGQCPKCVEDEKVSAAANAELQGFHPAIAAEVMPLVTSRESEVEELTYRAFDLYMARVYEEARQLLPTFEAAVRQQIYTEEWDKIADRRFQEIVARRRAERG